MVAFRRHDQKDQLKYIGIRHEGAASFAASAYAKSTGKPAACFAHDDPGMVEIISDVDLV